jgi:hypothetical protein
VTVEREAARLDQQRLLALDLRIQADLALGRHADLIGELEQLVGEHPLQEQFIAHLMLALYRCRRQADALTVYRDTYDRLLDEVGVSPGPALQALHERILRQDPALELTPPSTSGETTRSGVRHPPAPVPSTAPGTGSGPPRTRTRRRPLVTTAVAVAAVLGGGAAALHAVGAAPWQNPQPAPSKQPPAGSVFNEFDLAVHPGIGYDLDIPPGRPPDWHATNNPRSPDYAFLDFYRTGPRPTTLGGQISGVSLTNNDADFNAIHKLNPDQPATDCLGLPTRTVGNIHLDQLHAGDKVCLHTHENRWAFITVTRMPSEPAALLFVHVTVLNP